MWFPLSTKAYDNSSIRFWWLSDRSCVPMIPVENIDDRIREGEEGIARKADYDIQWNNA
jgi:hypothetical protein